ncbi:hypothetical protein D3C76_1408100 [compost metagenome]
MAVRAQVFHGPGLPAPTMMVLVTGSKLALCQGAPPPWFQDSTLPLDEFGSSGQDGAFTLPVTVLSLPLRRPMWPSTKGRIQISSPVSGSRANRRPTTPNSSPELPWISSTLPVLPSFTMVGAPVMV